MRKIVIVCVTMTLAGACADGDPQPTSESSAQESTTTGSGSGIGTWTTASASETATTGSETTTGVTDDTGSTATTSDTGDTNDTGDTVECRQPSSFNPSGTTEWTDGPYTASVAVDNPDSCVRRYTLSTTAPLRDNLPENPRVIVERDHGPRLRSGHHLFDALYALTIEEVDECSVATVTDYAFNFGGAVPCGAEGCFETGRLWNYVWTRDTAYATDLGLADLDPLRARNSLRFKLSERRGGGDLQIVQDTGTGGSYPVSSDRVTWAIGARTTLAALDGAARGAFADMTFEAVRNTVAHDRKIVFDPGDGLYFGEQSFLDWREQSYPIWTAGSVVHIAKSKSLSTNLAHLAALELLAELATERGEAALASEAAGWATDLRAALQGRLWLPEDGQFSSHITTGLDPSPTRRLDLLGLSLAILMDVADPDQAQKILSGYPHYGPGVPVLWPQQQFIPIYHNRGEWPFVTAYWLRAAAHAGHDAVGAKMIRALIRGAALNLSNMENFDAGSGAVWVDEGDTSGPVVNSQRQLWSVAAYVSMVHQVIFGLQPEPTGLRVRPFMPAELRAAIFGQTNALVLNAYPFRGRGLDVTLHLPESAGTGVLGVGEIRVNNQAIAGDLIDAELLVDGATIDIDLLPGATPPTSLTSRSDADYREIFGPRNPWITGLASVGGKVRLTLDLGGENPADLSLRILKDGEVVADNLPGNTATWVDPESDTNSESSPCYSVAASYASGNHSQHAPPACWWGPGNAHIVSFGAAEMSALGGNPSDDWGRFHYEGWGAPDHTLTLPSFTPNQSGRHLFQVLYGNGSGSINTGITCGVKRLRVQRVADNTVVGEGVLIMPHLGTWDRWEDSNLVSVDLQAGVEYRVVILEDTDTINMSSFQHFEIYTGGLGGVGGIHNNINIAELRVLAKP